MAHSLFEPAPPPLHEKIWRRVRDLNFSSHSRDPQSPETATGTDPALLLQAASLDARGRLQLLESALISKPFGK